MLTATSDVIAFFLGGQADSHYDLRAKESMRD